MEEWFTISLGVDPSNLYPSVRCGVEAALLTAMAHSRGKSLATLLSPPAAAITSAVSSRTASGAVSISNGSQTSAPCFDSGAVVSVNGLVGGTGTAAEAAEQALLLVQQGFGTIKIKVSLCRGTRYICKE